jgi:hypothetical protein
VSEAEKNTTERRVNTDILYGFEAGRADAFLEAAKMLEMSQAAIRLHAGEMTAQEMRTVKAVLKWKAGEIRGKANG